MSLSNQDSGYTSPPEISPPLDHELLKNAKIRGRRASVSAECDVDVEACGGKFTPAPANNKTPEEESRILAAVAENFLFASLDEDQRQLIIDAMVEQHVDAGTTVIEQGDEGDYFYVIDSGSCEVLKDGEKVFEYQGSGSFGELALMYMAPRAATVRTITKCTLWRVDRVTFHHILLVSKSQKRQLYEAFLQSCPLFANLEASEIGRLADVLQEKSFKPGEVIIQQGDSDIGRMNFYMVQEGEAEAYQTLRREASVDEKLDETEQQVLVGTMKKGQFFGERALLCNEPRAATVIAKTKLKVAALDVAGFERLLGPCREIMQGTIADYLTAEEMFIEQKS